MLKRAFDIVSSIGLLIVCAVPILLICLLLIFTQGRPVFFRQRRPGRHEKPFVLIKFRTMATDPNEFEAKDTHTPDAARLTPAGRWLRATSLDELPTFWNVVRGDMSLVGPRPLLMHYLPLYDTEQRKRHLVRPGITGWAQVNGRNEAPWGERLRMDVWYIENRTFWLDVKILIRTIYTTAAREGVGSPGEPTSSPFKGSGER
jgi:lipopolysaccharide/colanic/teichoic acid biosynthesis glycosyltransferase